MKAVSASLLFIASINILSPRQNGRHFPDDIFKCIFLNEYVWIAIQISLKFAPKDLIDLIPGLVQIMADQATSHYLNQWWLVYWRIYASLGFSVLRGFNCWRLIYIMVVDINNTVRMHKTNIKHAFKSIQWHGNLAYLKYRRTKHSE